ncbi:MAG: tripartite tricarboxylate transporter permease, partial [Candidatus Altiarchaeota archaeon]|nr:tripartite tricarboxylate transporter permease [Candidatus Altiarchaeota archaeon]
MIRTIALALAGSLIGTLTGLTPGLHVNTVCVIGLGLYPKLGLSTIDFGVIMVAMALTQNFIDFIPSIFTGVPEEETALSILPAHRLVIGGRAQEAVALTAYGSLLGVIYSLILLIPTLYIIPIAYETLKGTVMYIVLAAVIVLIIREKNKAGAVTSFLLAGTLGITTFNLAALSSSEALFPLFTGLFGFSSILTSLNENTSAKPQKKGITVKLDKTIAASGLIGSLCGIIVGLLPGMSPSQVGILAYDLLGSNLRGFLVSVSAINTSDAIYSLISLYTIDNPRSGVAAMLGQIMEVDYTMMMLFIGVIGVTAIIATATYLALGSIAMKFFTKINYRTLNMLILLLMAGLVYIMTGALGLCLAGISTAIGIIPIRTG